MTEALSHIKKIPSNIHIVESPEDNSCDLYLNGIKSIELAGVNGLFILLSRSEALYGKYLSFETPFTIPYLQATIDIASRDAFAKITISMLNGLYLHWWWDDFEGKVDYGAGSLRKYGFMAHFPGSRIVRSHVRL
jgi:hypothetical protein